MANYTRCAPIFVQQVYIYRKFIADKCITCSILNASLHGEVIDNGLSKKIKHASCRKRAYKFFIEH